MKDWKTIERVEGKFRVVIPEDVAPGSYQIKVMLMDNVTGELIPPAHNLEAKGLEAAVALSTRVEVVDGGQAMDAAETDRLAALDTAQKGECESAWTLWKNATRHVGRNRNYRNKYDETLRTSVAACYIGQARAAQDEAEQIKSLEQAHFWDHRVDGFTTLANPIAERFFEKGNSALADEDWDEAYLAYTQALRLNPSLSWARRYAEDARDKRLRIVRPYQKEDAKKSTPAKKPTLPTKRLERKINPKSGD